MSHLELATGLDELIASRILAPVVNRAADNVRDGAQRVAPKVGVWLSARDERVRPSHREADGQEAPDNLRFKVPKVNGIGYDLARGPRDPDLPLANRAACRCQVGTLDTALADSIHTEPLEVVGTVVRRAISTEFPRAGESEMGTSDDAAARFMRRGLNSAAARMREVTARGT